jgi:hypothetical protein
MNEFFWDGFEKQAISAGLATAAFGERFARGFKNKRKADAFRSVYKNHIAKNLGSAGKKSWRDPSVPKAMAKAHDSVPKSVERALDAVHPRQGPRERTRVENAFVSAADKNPLFSKLRDAAERKYGKDRV